jgi:hypothetical protein
MYENQLAEIAGTTRPYSKAMARLGGRKLLPEKRCQKSARPQTIGDNPSEGRQPKEKYPNQDHDPRHHRVCTLACRWIRILSSLRKFDVHPANQA